jgi:CO/xanthine dehydrogenase Mo-binding subunit
MTTTQEPKQYKVIGTRPIRHDGYEKVVGKAKYAADFQAAGLLHAKVLRSPHAHARIKSVDVSKALALPGVKAVITGQDLWDGSDKIADLGETAVRTRYLSHNLLARGKALYKGHAIAAVAATSPHIAEQAISLINVDYEPLPPVMSWKDAMASNAPLLHEDLVTTELGKRTDKKSNVASRVQFKKGDPDAGFKKADVVVEREFDTGFVHQGYIEPHAATAAWAADGRCTVWCSSQGPFAVRANTAMLLNIPESLIKVVPLEIGGGFGGKLGVYLEPLVALLAKKAGAPVKAVMGRGEVFEGTGPTSGSHMRVKMGVTNEGRLTAAVVELYYEAGAFPGSAVGAGAMCALAPYNVENGQVDGWDIVVNKPKTSAYRAPGAPAAAFAVESVVDELCQKINMDPLEFRLLNAVKEGDRRVDGPAFGRIGYQEVLQAVKNHPHWKSRLTGKNRGRGLAVGFWFNAGGPASCYIAVNGDGTISLTEGASDIGGTRPAVAMQAAEVLGIAAEKVTPTVVDTDSIGYTSLTGGSSVAMKVGYAAYEAAQDVKRQMIARAAKIWETQPENVEFEDGVFKLKPSYERRMTFAELAARLNNTGGPITGRASVDARGVGPAFAACIGDVEVDPDTGKTTVLRFTIIQDAGKAIHPSYVEGQMQGGVAQGIGWALNEEYVFNPQGQMSNPTFLDYRMPTALDLPMIETQIVEVPNPGHPYGVRGVGEVPIVPPIPAVANAIARAIGVRMTVLPMSPTHVLEALWAKSKNGSKR